MEEYIYYGVFIDPTSIQRKTGIRTSAKKENYPLNILIQKCTLVSSVV
jgi:hypothetical protein